MRARKERGEGKGRETLRNLEILMKDEGKGGFVTYG